MVLEDRFAFPQRGRVRWIGLRPGRRQPVVVVDAVLARSGRGLEGDRYRGRDGKRAVTLVQAEHLPVIAALLGRDEVVPEWLRRNLVVAGVNLQALIRRRFRIGDALLEGTGAAHPCSRMEETFGPGGWNALRGHGGITARVLHDGVIRVGAAVVPLAGAPTAGPDTAPETLQGTLL